MVCFSLQRVRLSLRMLLNFCVMRFLSSGLVNNVVVQVVILSLRWLHFCRLVLEDVGLRVSWRNMVNICAVLLTSVLFTDVVLLFKLFVESVKIHLISSVMFLVQCLIVVVVLEFHNRPLLAGSFMVNQFLQVACVLAIFALCMRVWAFHCIMPDLIILRNLSPTALADNFHLHAVIKFVSSKYKLIISKLILTSLVVAFESDFIQIAKLKLVQELQTFLGFFIVALAWGWEEFGWGTRLPLFVAWLAEVHLALRAFFSLDDNVCAERAAQVLE